MEIKISNYLQSTSVLIKPQRQRIQTFKEHKLSPGFDLTRRAPGPPYLFSLGQTPSSQRQAGQMCAILGE